MPACIPAPSSMYMNRDPDQEKRIKARLSEAAGMPKDVVLGVPVVTMNGREELCIENYRGIIEYTEELIRVQTKTGQIRIAGKRMQIEYYTNDEMKITGQIASLEYVK